jgi:hypothetical protein
MAPSPHDFDQPPPFSAGSPQARDSGLRRGRRLTRWIAVTAVAGAAALGSLYTHLLPGGTAAPAPTSPPVRTPTTSTATTAGDDDEEHGQGGHESDDDEDEGAAPATPPEPRQGPQPPARPPSPTRQQPHTTTGAS